tara:strand:+ start:1080 stop:1598 length:519 start_codon:yes stop_codon:yes gene_type:complete
MDIKVNRLSGYKVDNDPKIIAAVDKTINAEWWDAEGWSTMYDMSIEDMKKEWKSMDDEFLQIHGDSTSHNLNKTEKGEKLKGVFDFIEKKDKYESPYTLQSIIKTIKPNTIYPGKVGFGILDKKGNVVLVPYPGGMNDISGEVLSPINNVRDGGIFTWDDNVEKNMSDDFII